MRNPAAERYMLDALDAYHEKKLNDRLRLKKTMNSRDSATESEGSRRPENKCFQLRAPISAKEKLSSQ